MKSLLILLVILSVGCVYAGKGDIISEFTLSGQPTGGVRGLAYDPYDGNIWAAGPNDLYENIFCKFENDETHTIVQQWQLLEGQYWIFDIGYKYIFDGKDCIVTWAHHPHDNYYLYDKTDGSYIGSLPDPFPSGYGEGVSGDYENGWGVTLYVTNYGYDDIMKWDGSLWTVWATTLSPAMGCCYGWSHVFVIHTYPAYKIRSIRVSDSTVEEDIPLNNWGECYMVGLSRGRDNFDGINETLYTATFFPSNLIKEIDIGNYNQTDIEATSVGNIKAMFN